MLNLKINEQVRACQNLTGCIYKLFELALFFSDLEAQIAQIQSRKRRLEDGENSENGVGNENSVEKIAFGSVGGYDTARVYF